MDRVSPHSSSGSPVATRNSPVNAFRFPNGRPNLPKPDSGKDLSSPHGLNHYAAPPSHPSATATPPVAVANPVTVNTASLGNPSSTQSSPTSVASTTRLPTSTSTRKVSATSSIADYPTESRKQLRNLKSELDSRRLQISDLEHRLSTAQRDSASKDEEIQRLENQVESLLGDTKTKYRKMQELQKQMDEMEASVRVARAERDNAVMRADEADEELEVKRAEWERAEMEADERIERGYGEMESVRREMERERDSLRGRETEMRREMDKLAQDSEGLKAQVTSLKQELANKVSEFDVAQTQVRDMTAKLEADNKAQEWKQKVREEYQAQLDAVQAMKDKWEVEMADQVRLWQERVDAMGENVKSPKVVKESRVDRAISNIVNAAAAYSANGSAPAPLRSQASPGLSKVQPKGRALSAPGAASNLITEDLREQITRLEGKNRELEAANKALHRAVEVMASSARSFKPSPMSLLEGAPTMSNGAVSPSSPTPNGIHPTAHSNPHAKVDPAKLQSMTMQELQVALQAKTSMADTITGLSVRVAYLTMLNEVNEESVSELMGMVNPAELKDMP